MEHQELENLTKLLWQELYDIKGKLSMQFIYDKLTEEQKSFVRSDERRPIIWE